MTWYAAHAILYVRFKAGRQRRFPVWENVLLIRARTAREAWRKGERRAREDEGDCGGTFRWGGRRAEWVFAGLRKVVAVSTGSKGQPRDGDEITYNEYEVADAAALERLTAGESVSLKYGD